MIETVQWLKIKVGMFDGGSLKRIRNAKIGGESYRDKLTAVWFEILDFAGKCNENGALICDLYDVPFTDLDDLATMINRDPDELRLCMQYFVKAGMVEITGDVYSVANWAKYQNEDKLAEIRERKRISQKKWRDKQNGLLPSGDTPECRISVESPENLPSISISSSLSTSTRDDKKGCGEEKKGKKPVEQPPFDFSTTNFSPALVATVENWLRYKSERREAYKPTGLQSLMAKIKNEASQYGEQAVMNVITESMAANYQGIVWDKLKNKNGGGQRGTFGSSPAVGRQL